MIPTRWLPLLAALAPAAHATPIDAPSAAFSITYAELALNSENPQRTLSQVGTEAAVVSSPTTGSVAQASTVPELGKLRAYFEAMPGDIARVSANFGDAVRFFGLAGIGAPSPDPFEVTVRWTISGAIAIPDANARFNVPVGYESRFAMLQFLPDGSYGRVAQWVDATSWLRPTEYLKTFSTTFLAEPGAWYQVVGYLEGYGWSADYTALGGGGEPVRFGFGNSATLAFDLPDGTGFESASGRLLQSVSPPPPVGVPEPGTLALLGAAFGVVALQRRRHGGRRAGSGSQEPVGV